MIKSAAVDVTATLKQAADDVLSKARFRHEAALAAYQAGVRGMATSGGTLPPDDADRLLAACQALDIPADRLALDVFQMQRHEAAAAEILAIEARNIERQEPIPRLQAAVEQETAAWLALKEDCDARLKAAQATLTAARKAAEAAHRVRLESSEPQQREMLSIADRCPHLFKPVDAERLRRIVRPESRHPLLG